MRSSRRHPCLGSGRQGREYAADLRSRSLRVIESVFRRQPKALHAGMLHMGSLRVHHTHGGRGTPVLFIHGLGSSGYLEWRFNLEPAAACHRIYAPDLPGFGRSEKPRARYGIGYFTRFIERYMEGRGLRSAAVVGASLGGRVALELALRHPQRVSKLVLVNSLGLGRPTLRLTYGLMTLPRVGETVMQVARNARSEEHTSELQSRSDLVCRLLLEKKK